MAKQILIAGAGIGGLAAALALAKGKQRVCVLEQAPLVEEIGAGLQLGPNATGVLQQLGVDEQVSEFAGFPDAVCIRDGITGKTLNQVRLGPDFQERFGAPYRVIHRGDLLGLLLKAVQTRKTIKLETSARVQSFEDLGDKGVEVDTATGRRKGGMLIGADGIRSAVRGQLLDDGAPTSAGHIIARSLVSSAQMPVSDNVVTLWLVPGGHVVHYPLRGGRVFNLVAAWDGDWAEATWGMSADATEVEALAAGAHEQLRAILAAAPNWRKWSAAHRAPAPKWGEGNVSLLGDAAHPVLPYLAQGAVMALEDAVVLAGELAKADTHSDALRAYEAARQPRLAQMYDMCRKAGLAYHAGGVFRLVRNFILQRMSDNASRNRVAWIYDWRSTLQQK